MKTLALSIVALVISSAPALTCRADEAHNRKYHGDPQCLQCTCLHHHDDHGDETLTETLALASFETNEAVSPVLSIVESAAAEHDEVSE